MKSTATSVSFEEQLNTYKKILEPAIEDFCKRVESDVAEVFGEYSLEATKAFNAILLRGGKRVRGALVLAGYEMCGGVDLQKVLPLAVAMEVLQVYLLIADDIYDRSATRRGGPSAHVMMRDLHTQRHWRGDSVHFGESIASCVTLAGNNLAMEEITTAPLDDSTKVIILRLLNKALRITDQGQINDIFNEAVREVNDRQVQQTLTWKTAFYTFIGPLQAGAIAAGVREAELGCLHDYGTHVGLAFQVADDILGTFGNEAESGKSTTDDLREGKVTVLIARALTNAASEPRKQLLACLGKEDLTQTEYETCKTIITETGALDFARQLAQDNCAQAVEALSKAPPTWRTDMLDFLRALASFVVDRKK